MKKNNLPLNENQIVKILKKTDNIQSILKNNNLYIVTDYFALKIDSIALQNYPKLQMHIRSIFGNIQEGESYRYSKQYGIQAKECEVFRVFPKDYLQNTFEYQCTRLYYHINDSMWKSNKACIFKTQSTDKKHKYIFIDEELVSFCNILTDDTLTIRGYNNAKSMSFIQYQNNEFILIVMPMNIKDNIEFLNYM